jgi:hypothetical protein
LDVLTPRFKLRLAPFVKPRSAEARRSDVPTALLY